MAGWTHNTYCVFVELLIFVAILTYSVVFIEGENNNSSIQLTNNHMLYMNNKEWHSCLEKKHPF